MASREPRNPFYLLLLLASLLFVTTALAYGVVPVLEEKAARAGEPVPPSLLRDALRARGPWWLFGELGAMVLFGALSMGLDRLRSLKKERAAARIGPSPASPPPVPDGDDHAIPGTAGRGAPPAH
jgi:hypothetical protein